MGAIAGSATAGAIAAVVLVGGSQPAFAGWTAAPTTPSTAQSATASDSCATSLANAPTLAGVASSSWQPVITDVRGPFTIVLYASGDSAATCFTGPGFTVVNRRSANAAMASVSSTGQSSGTPGGTISGSTRLSVLSGGDIDQLTVANLVSSADGAYTLVDGQVDSSVTGVTLVEADGSQVQASVEDGWLLAWWPGSEGVTSALVTTAGGTTDQQLTASAPVGPPPGSAALCEGASPTSSGVSCEGAGGAATTPSG